MTGTIALGVFSLLLSFVNLDVPLYSQMPMYPTACESVATVASLNYLGYDITIDEFLDSYLPTVSFGDERVAESDYNIFDYYFVGNPRTYGGWLCNPPVIVGAVQNYFFDTGEHWFSAYDYTGVNFNFLLDEVAQGRPVVIWVTQGFEDSAFVDLMGNPYCAKNHAVVLSGYDRTRGVVMITDSIDGRYEVDYYKAKSVFDFAGKRSVVFK